MSWFYFTLSWSLNLLINVFRFKMWLQTYLLVSEAIVWRFFQCLLQNNKGLLRGFPSLNRLTWKFKPFNKCFLSQNVTANFSLMLLQFCPCVWKARKASRLVRKVKDVFRFVDHLFKYELHSPGLDSQKDF